MATIPGWQPLTGKELCDGIEKACGFNEFFQLIKNAITDLFLFSTLIVIFMIIFTGFELLTSKGNPNALTAAKTRFGKVIWGYVWIMAAWLIVYTITSTLIKADFNFLLAK